MSTAKKRTRLIRRGEAGQFYPNVVFTLDMNFGLSHTNAISPLAKDMRRCHHVFRRNMGLALDWLGYVVDLVAAPEFQSEADLGSQAAGSQA